MVNGATMRSFKLPPNLAHTVMISSKKHSAFNSSVAGMGTLNCRACANFISDTNTFLSGIFSTYLEQTMLGLQSLQAMRSCMSYMITSEITLKSEGHGAPQNGSLNEIRM